jgi:GxxExxY protein
MPRWRGMMRAALARLNRAAREAKNNWQLFAYGTDQRGNSTGRAEERKSGRFEDGTGEVIGGLIEVHGHLGPGLLESAYEACLCAELSDRQLKFERQRPLPIKYKGMHIDCGYRLDLIVEDCILLELKAVERLLPIHEAKGGHLSATVAAAGWSARELQLDRPAKWPTTAHAPPPRNLPFFRPSCVI